MTTLTSPSSAKEQVTMEITHARAIIIDKGSHFLVCSEPEHILSFAISYDEFDLVRMGHSLEEYIAIQKAKNRSKIPENFILLDEKFERDTRTGINIETYRYCDPSKIYREYKNPSIDISRFAKAKFRKGDVVYVRSMGRHKDLYTFKGVILYKERKNILNAHWNEPLYCVQIGEERKITVRQSLLY